MDNYYGIITGDIVGSTKLDNRERDHLFEALHKTIDDINYQINYQSIEIDVYRGDSFQVKIYEAWDSLRVALLIRLGLLSTQVARKHPSKSKWDARLSIGIGTINYIKDDLRSSDGEAFHNSGRAFDALKKLSRLTIRTPWQDLDEEFDVECFMADTIIKRLSDKQAGITYMYLLQEITQKLIAENLQVTPQAVNKSLQHGGNALFEFIKRFEFLIKKVIP